MRAPFQTETLTPPPSASDFGLSDPFGGGTLSIQSRVLGANVANYSNPERDTPVAVLAMSVDDVSMIH